MRKVRIPVHLYYLTAKAVVIVWEKERRSGEDTARLEREGICSLNSQHHPMKHACNQQGHSSTNSFHPNSSITGKLDLLGPPFWLYSDQPTRTERSISSMLTLTALQSRNTIHDKLSPNSSWTGSNTFFIVFLLFFMHALVPNQKALPQLRRGDDWNVSGCDINVTRRKNF